MNIEKKGAILARFVLSMVLMFLIGFNTFSMAEVPPVKIGGNFELTGKYANYGKAFLDAAKFNIERKNAEGGIKSLGGAKIELVVFDNATDPKLSISIVERLGSNSEILAILGPCLTPCAVAAEPMIGRWKIPTVFDVVTLDDIFDRGNNYVFTVLVLTSRMAATYAEFMVTMHNNYGIPLDRITMGYPDNDLGKTVAKYFRETLQKRRYEKNIVADVPFDWLAKDLTPVVLKIKAAKPDFHMQVAYTEDGKLWHDACYTQNFKPHQVGGAGGYNDPLLLNLLGDKIFGSTLGNGKSFGFDMVSWGLPNASRDAYLRDFQSKYPKMPYGQTYVLLGSMATQVVIDAIEEAGKNNREAVTEALHKMKLEKNDPRDLTGMYETPGPIWMPNGKPNSYGYVIEWREEKGKWDKFSVYHPSRGIVTTPKAFKK